MLWQLIVWGFSVPTFMAPSPIAVIGAFRDNAATLWANFVPTLIEALLGFLFGNVVAVLLAVWFVYSPTAEKAFYPIAVIVKSIPIIAIAPILVLLVGNGIAPKIIIAALICFFPTLVNMVQGLKAASPAMLDLMRVLSASGAEIFWKVRLPASLPFLFAALKFAATSSVVGRSWPNGSARATASRADHRRLQFPLTAALRDGRDRRDACGRPVLRGLDRREEGRPLEDRRFGVISTDLV